LRFDWIQDPEVVLDEKLKTVGLECEYLETDPELFKVFHNKLYWSLEESTTRFKSLWYQLTLDDK